MSAVKKSAWKLIFALALLLGVSVLAGCSSSSENKASSNTSFSDMAAMDSNRGAASPAEAANSVSSEKLSQAVKVSNQAGFNATAGSGAVSPPMADSTGTAGEGFDRKLIYRANITMEVEDYAGTQSKIRDMVALSDGYILEFSDSKTTYEQSGNFVIRVPAQGFFSFIDQLRAIQPNLQQSVKGQDFTEEYVDLTSRLKAKRLVEERLSSFMEKATRADDLLQFSNQLAAVQEEIERIEGRIRYINQNVEYSTIELRVYQRLEKNGIGSNTDASFGDQILNAMKSSAEFVSRFLQGLVIAIAALLPVLALLALICVPLLYWYLKKRASSSRATKQGRQSANEDRVNEDPANAGDGSEN